ncbi:MAG TPA: LamG domain-containing protein, partial [Planctomycetota bacterium]|nr:LamG domain-containing protein [Planctomycetota bacterium]
MRSASRSATLAALLLLAAPVAAQGPAPIVYTWDAQPLSPGIQGGTGVWELFTGLNFPTLLDKHFVRFDPASGFSSTTAWSAFSNADDARVVFGVSGGEVSLVGAIDAERLRFDVGGYRLDGTGTLRTREVEVATGTGTLDLPLLGVPQLAKLGAGTLALSPSVGAASFGALVVDAGTIAPFGAAGPTLTVTNVSPAVGLELHPGAEVAVPLALAGAHPSVHVFGPGTSRLSGSTVALTGPSSGLLVADVAVDAGALLDVTASLQSSAWTRLDLNGPGDVRLHAAGSLSGFVLVAGGRLILDCPSGAATGLAGVDVAGALGGSGTIAAPLYVYGTGLIDPGTPESPFGEIAAAGLQLEPGSRVVFDVGPTGNDHLTIGASPLWAHAPVTLTLHDLGGLAPGRAIELIDFSGAPAGATLSPSSFQLDSPAAGALTVLDRRLVFFVGATPGDCDGNSIPDSVELAPVPGGVALRFQGSDAHVAIPGASLPASWPTPLTIESWIRPLHVSGTQCIASRSVNDLHAFGLGIENGRVTARRRDAGDLSLVEWRSAPGAVSPGLWQHVAATIDAAGSASLYVNGAPVAIDAVAVSPASNVTVVPTGNVCIGAVESVLLPPGAPPAERLYGSIADVRLWSVARTPAEIAAAMSSALTGAEPGLAACWSLEEGAGSAVGDLTGAHAGAVVPADGLSWEAVPKDVDGNGALDACTPATV